MALCDDKKLMFKVHPEGDLYQMSVPYMIAIPAKVVKTTLEARYNLVYRQNFRLYAHDVLLVEIKSVCLLNSTKWLNNISIKREMCTALSAQTKQKLLELT